MRHIAMIGLIALASCSPSPKDSRTYTLYRGSIASGIDRIHIATFNADEPASYNEENCNIVRQFFADEGYAVSYWCERGPYRP